jgi:hypothetical protein
METTTLPTIQDQRRTELKDTAFSVSRPASAEIKSLREKAAAMEEKAASFETEQTNAYLAVENLLDRRAKTLEGINALEKIADDVKNLDTLRRNALDFFIKSSLSREQIDKQNFIIISDTISRLTALAPAIPAYLSEKQAVAAQEADEIKATATKHRINLSEMRDHFQTRAKEENGEGRFSKLSAGFAGLIDN